MKKAHQKKKNPVPVIILITVGVVILGLIIYSVSVYKKSEESTKGFFICNKENTICELSEHIHADVHMTVCGQQVNFPKEKGRLDRQHTHKEKNKIHWHARIGVDPTTREPLDKTPLTIAAFLKEVDYTLPLSCPANQYPILSVIVNGNTAQDRLQYVWKDGEQIVMTYE